MSLVSEHEVEAFLEAHPTWQQAGGSITKTFEFSDFNESMGFVVQVALVAEKTNHHPDLDIRWNRVSVTLSTHSEGGLTSRDLDLADRCDLLIR